MTEESKDTEKETHSYTVALMRDVQLVADTGTGYRRTD